MNPCWYACAALLVDRAAGDPAWLPHPVAVIGRCIGALEKVWNRTEYGGRLRRLLGAATAACVAGGAWAAVWCLLRLAAAVSPWLYGAVSVAFIWTTVAWRGLYRAGADVHGALAGAGLAAARERVARYVGRDTAHLSEEGVIRATVETLAENTVDAIVSPLLYACLGGAPLAMAYRAVNTLDSMLGHKSERYRDFGWASARLDDAANYVPARLCGVLLLIAARLSGLSARAAARVWRRDARAHPSPNAGIPEAVMAGALQVQLGGLNTYGGVPHRRATLGEPLRPLEARDIVRAMRVVEWLGWLVLAGIAAAAAARG